MAIFPSGFKMALRNAFENVATDKAVKGITDYETRLDYEARGDLQPVYVGRALDGTGVVVEIWTIEKITYDGQNRPTRKQVKSNVAWSTRAALNW